MAPAQAPRPAAPSLVLALVAGLAACGPGVAPSRAPASPPGRASAAPSSGTALERYFPAPDAAVYAYDTRAEGGGSGLLVLKVRRLDAHRAEIEYPSGRRKRFAYAREGVVVEPDGYYLLRAPLEVGASWRGERGTVTVRAVEGSAEVPAGKFVGCVETVEARGGDAPLAVATTYCPDVGVVSVVVESGARAERADLRSFGAPIDVGPDGLTTTRERSVEPAR